MATLAAMNEPATVTERPDGYIQDTASQWVAELVEADPGMRVADVCAAPGGKATALAATGATVVAADRRASRARLVVANAERLGIDARALATVVADARRPPFAPASFDRVLVDAPCSGLGALRRRPDARWRIEEGDVDRLAGLQRDLVDAAVPLLRPGGVLVYSVCTLTAAESLAVDEHLAARCPQLEPLATPAPPWEPYGRGARVLPHSADTDGMVVLRLRLPVRYHFGVDSGRA
jgi:16S rRNA (cytosine967-C5)-methyltransferase